MADFGLGIAPGEWDWLYGGPLGGLSPGGSAIPRAPTKSGGILGGLNKATEQFGGPLTLGLSILANSGPSQYKRGFGEILGTSALQAQQMGQQRGDDELRRKYLESQIEAMRRGPARKPIAVTGQDGKPVYVDEQDAIGKSPYSEPRADGSSASSIQEYEAAVATGFKGSYLEFIRHQAQARFVNPPQQPLVAVQTPDGRSIFVPRDQAIGLPPAAPREGAVPTEGERTAANYLGRMQSTESLLGDYKPTARDYIAAQQLMSGGAVRSSVANSFLSPEGQKYYQAAADWVRAKLRKESGAVISPEEMAQEIKTYFPLPNDSAETIEQKRQARLQAQRGMQQMSGRAVQPTGLNDMTIYPQGSPEDAAARGSGKPKLRYNPKTGRIE